MAAQSERQRRLNAKRTAERIARTRQLKSVPPRLKVDGLVYDLRAEGVQVNRLDDAEELAECSGLPFGWALRFIEEE